MPVTAIPGAGDAYPANISPGMAPMGGGGTITVDVVSAFGAGYANPVAPETGIVIAVSAFGAGYAQSATVGFSHAIIPSTVTGYAYLARTRGFRAVPNIGVPVAPPPAGP